MPIHRIVVLTGAGLSAESGLGTFRGKGGVWSEFDLEEVATPEGFARNPARVHDFYNLRRRWLGTAQPNAAHRALAQLEREHKGEVLTVTQNIDPLHEAAGTKHLIHMHGELARALCRLVRRAFLGPAIFRPRRFARRAGKPAACGPMWSGSVKCRAKWIVFTRRFSPATCSSPSAPAAASIRRRALSPRREAPAPIRSSSISNPLTAQACSPKPKWAGHRDRSGLCRALLAPVSALTAGGARRSDIPGCRSRQGWARPSHPRSSSLPPG